MLSKMHEIIRAVLSVRLKSVRYAEFVITGWKDG